MVVAMSKPKRRSTLIVTRSETVRDLVTLKSEIDVCLVKLSEDPPVVERALSLLSGDERERAMRFQSGSLGAAFVVSQRGSPNLARWLLQSSSLRSQVCLRAPRQTSPRRIREPNPLQHVEFRRSRRIRVCRWSRVRDRHCSIAPFRTKRGSQRGSFRLANTQSSCVYLKGNATSRSSIGGSVKEACIKARGEDLSIPLDTFQGSLTPRMPARLISVNADVAEASEWTIQKFTPAREFLVQSRSGIGGGGSKSTRFALLGSYYRNVFCGNREKKPYHDL